MRKVLAVSLAFHPNDPCPKCGKPTMQSTIERHPRRDDIAIHNFYCGACGPVKSKIISLTPGKPSPEAAA